MEPQEFDPFAVFKRPRPADMNVEDRGRKAVHMDPSTTKTAREQEIIDPMALLETNLIKESIANTQAEDLLQEDSEEENAKYKLEEFELEILRSEEGCIHEVYIPKGYERNVYNGSLNAKVYPFKLDPFQSKAVRAIESDESVLVCAHTSAGKTAIAEYSIAVSLKQNSRVIYTSPIKALSNQKYRQLKQEFGDVGLVTGDVTIDPESTCLVMTTEILRSMIYRGSEVVRQVKWVIFDEVHYMRDKERGVVWEQTIIMLPRQVKYVFLSATIGNPGEFAHWITKLKHAPCNVVYTDYRPVPLEHYLCPSGAEAIYMVVDQKSRFLQENFNKAIEKLGDTVDVVGLATKKNKKKLTEGSDLNKLIKLIMEKHFDPVIVFSFSKKDVEAYALSMIKFDLTTKDEKDRITEIFTNAINILSDEDRRLPQITSVLTILQKGIGIHHGGLLPLIKEVIEILFQEGLLKCLFSTETFSMGLNMPARTVVFTSVRKFDGEQFRWMGGGEYIQMSGRAGRRGLDKKGITILMIDQKMEPEIARNMLKGNSDDLLSSFYINTNMLINSQRLEDMDPQYIIRRSLLQFQNDIKLPKLVEQHNRKVQSFEQLKLTDETEVERLYYIVQRINDYKEDIRRATMKPNIALGYLCVGRIIRLRQGTVDWGYAISINFHAMKDKKDKKKKEEEEKSYLIDAMVYIKPRKNNEPPVPCPLSEVGELVVLTFTLATILEITRLKISNLPNDLSLPASKATILNTLKALVGGSQAIKPIDLSGDDPAIHERYKLLRKVEEERAALKKYEPLLEEYTKKKELYDEIKASNKKLKASSGMVMKTEKKALMRVLKRTGLVEKSVVTLKGNVTCEISSNHEILLTQLLFTGFFSDIGPKQIAAVLSSLVHDEKATTDKKFVKTEVLMHKLQELQVQAKLMYQVLSQCKVKVEEVIAVLSQEEYLDSIKETLVEVTYNWCNGQSFEEICKQTDSFEGSIIRTLRRLDELLKQMDNAAKVIGNKDLSEKFAQASRYLKRGIVFAASLYL